MGLLDDAIREHLELKRLRGADPGDVARAEQDALGPLRQNDEPEPDEGEVSVAEDPPGLDGSFFSESEPVSDSGASVTNHVSQETVEINMEAELARGIDSGHEDDAASGLHAPPSGHLASPGVEDREEIGGWETPSSHPDELGEITSSESAAESRPSRDSADGERLEGATDEVATSGRDVSSSKRRWLKRRAQRDLDD